MRTTRRKLLGMLSLGAAAAALGTGKAEVAGHGYGHVVTTTVPEVQLPASEHQAALAQARADGYNRGYSVADARAQSRQEQVPVTFEELQGTCDQRGCYIDGHFSIDRLAYICVHGFPGQYPDDTLTMPKSDIEAVAAWVQRLHNNT